MFSACGREPSGANANTYVRVLNAVAPELAKHLYYDEIADRVYKTGANIPFTGKAVWLSEDARQLQETNYQDGREHGETVWWYSDGTRKGKAMYQNGRLHGTMLQWYRGGVRKELQILFENGHKVGQEVWWHKNGVEKCVVIFNQGEQSSSKGIYASGNIAWKARWGSGGLAIDFMGWYESGSVMFSRNLLNGKGKEVWWCENGVKSAEFEWGGGQLDGLLVEWDELGAKRRAASYVSGGKHGLETVWHENGAKNSEVEFNDGRAISFRNWTEDGLMIPMPPVPLGRLRPWAMGEIENFYKGRSRDFIYLAFGEPDGVGEGIWKYESISITGKKCSVQFTFENDMVALIVVSIPADS